MKKNDNYRITFTEEGLRFWEEIKRNTSVESPKNQAESKAMVSPGRNEARLEEYQKQFKRTQQNIQQKIEAKKAYNMIQSEERMQIINEQYLNQKKDAMNSIKRVRQENLNSSNKLKEQLEVYHKEKYVKHWDKIKQ